MHPRQRFDWRADGDGYTALMSIQDDGTLRVRADVVFPILGKSLVWTRVR